MPKAILQDGQSGISLLTFLGFSHFLVVTFRALKLAKIRMEVRRVINAKFD